MHFQLGLVIILAFKPFCFADFVTRYSTAQCFSAAHMKLSDLQHQLYLVYKGLSLQLIKRHWLSLVPPLIEVSKPKVCRSITFPTIYVVLITNIKRWSPRLRTKLPIRLCCTAPWPSLAWRTPCSAPSRSGPRSAHMDWCEASPQYCWDLALRAGKCDKVFPLWVKFCQRAWQVKVTSKRLALADRGSTRWLGALA